MLSAKEIAEYPPASEPYSVADLGCPCGTCRYWRYRRGEWLAMERDKKPRARLSQHGVDYWVVWKVVDGKGYVGVGFTLPEAYHNWRHERRIP